MKRTILCLSTCALAATLLAQGPMQPGQTPVNDLKQALGLSDAQVNQLREIQRQQPNRDLFAQIAERQRTLDKLLSEGSRDALTLGNVLVDMQNLRAQVKQNNERMRQQALAVLTPDQMKNLAKLEEAVKLRPAIEQAYIYGLLEPPAASATGAGPGGPRMRMQRWFQQSPAREQ